MTAGSGGTYTFAMPSSDVEVSASFTQYEYAAVGDAAMTHGSVQAYKGIYESGEGEPCDYYEPGTQFTLVVKPDAGYTLSALYVVPAGSEKGESIAKDKQLKYIMTMGEEDLTVYADFEAIEKLNDRIGKVRQQIDAQPCAVVMRDGRKAFDEMMKMVNTRLQSVLAPGNEGKCTQSCAACGGKCR